MWGEKSGNERFTRKTLFLFRFNFRNQKFFLLLLQLNRNIDIENTLVLMIFFLSALVI